MAQGPHHQPKAFGIVRDAFALIRLIRQQRLGRLIGHRFNAHHQLAAAHVAHQGQVRQARQTRLEIGPDPGGIAQKILALHDLDVLQRRRAGDRIAAERVEIAEGLAEGVQRFGIGHDAADRVAVAHRLAHGDLFDNHTLHAGETDKPIAGLLEDLKQRGLLDSTLIVWGGEFGRQPVAEYERGTGRDHNAYGFTMWMAGGGI